MRRQSDPHTQAHYQAKDITTGGREINAHEERSGLKQGIGKLWAGTIHPTTFLDATTRVNTRNRILGNLKMIFFYNGFS
jgi:hypothetical protein